MSGFGSVQRETGKATFWKKNTKAFPGSIRPVYGAQHPPLQQDSPSESSHGGVASPTKKDYVSALNYTSSSSGTLSASGGGKSKRDSFSDFETKTSDAWDDGDDDLITMANVKMSLKDVHTSARAVIDSHARQMRHQDQQEQRVRHQLTPAQGHKHDEVAAWLSANDKNGAHMDSIPDTVPSTPPAVGSGSSGSSGPGVGIRLTQARHPPRASNSLRYQQVGSLNTSTPDREKMKLEKVQLLIANENTDLDDLRNTVWSGIPMTQRPITWKLLSGYLPARIERRQPTLERKRNEYRSFVQQYFDGRHSDVNQSTYKQIQKDLCRMTVLNNRPKIVEIFERILYIWAIRHPASSYVQGMNDLVTPFFVVFLSEFIQVDIESESCDVSSELSGEQLDLIEADCFWCFTKLLDGIQDNYTFAQPGIQVKVNALKELIKRIDEPLNEHLTVHSVEYLQFSFRWMNNLLMRELPLQCTIRLWDTYLAEVDGFATFHLYVCAGFLVRFSKDLLRQRDFQGLMLLLQNLPTHNWADEEIELLLAEAYKLKYMFADAPNHLYQSR